METAIVGHLGTPQLAALAIAATRLTLFNLLTYGTTAQVARLHGAGELFTVALLLAPPPVALIEGAVR
ncbi:MAG TPA: hypothetical protein VGB40_05420 [Rubrobacteraceae bacterium]